jgi:hypothetical protein
VVLRVTNSRVHNTLKLPWLLFEPLCVLDRGNASNSPYRLCVFSVPVSWRQGFPFYSFSSGFGFLRLACPMLGKARFEENGHLVDTTLRNGAAQQTLRNRR